jgi:hypothetical protein
VAQVLAAFVRDRRPRVQRVHLVQAHAVQARVMRFERIEHADRLSVGHRHDHVGTRLHVVEHRFRRDESAHPPSTPRVSRAISWWVPAEWVITW